MPLHIFGVPVSATGYGHEYSTARIRKADEGQIERANQEGLVEDALENGLNIQGSEDGLTDLL